MISTVVVHNYNNWLDNHGQRIIRTQESGEYDPDDLLDPVFPPEPDQPELLGEVLVEEAVDDRVGAGAGHSQKVTDRIDCTENLQLQIFGSNVRCQYLFQIKDRLLCFTNFFMISENRSRLISGTGSVILWSPINRAQKNQQNLNLMSLKEII